MLDILLSHLATASSHHLFETYEMRSLSSLGQYMIVIFPNKGIAEEREVKREILLGLVSVSYLLLSTS